MLVKGTLQNQTHILWWFQLLMHLMVIWENGQSYFQFSIIVYPCT